MKFLISLFFLMVGLIPQATFADAIASGRGLPNGKFWKSENQTWVEEKQLPEGVEIFALLKTDDGVIWAGGSQGSEGKVWRRGTEGWDDGTPLHDCTIIYALAAGAENQVWAAGNNFSSGGVWRFDGNEWDKGTAIPYCSILYGITITDDKNAWACGLSFRSRGRVWRFNGSRWDEGTDLPDAKELSSIVHNQEGKIFVGGASAEQGLVWTFNGTDWAHQEVPGARGVYTLAIGKDNTLWAGGAGKEKPLHLWQLSGEQWAQQLALEKAIALYAILPLSPNEILVGGWNSDRRGSIWTLQNNQITQKNDIPNSFVIRSIVNLN